ncbi:MAG TPA: hypothetical protein VK929_05665 [Longimicrobiales bacterium]|nr:hypothetical protein [Longimicrobiales bacterium]
MSKIAIARRFVRYVSFAAMLGLFLPACELSTAPDFPGQDEEEEDDEDPNTG